MSLTSRFSIVFDLIKLYMKYRIHEKVPPPVNRFETLFCNRFVIVCNHQYLFPAPKVIQSLPRIES